MRCFTLAVFSLTIVTCHAQILTISEEFFDFGKINDISLVYKTITLANTGDALLEIKSTKGTCGCAVGMPEKNELEPGESTELRIRFMPATYNGVVKKAIRVVTNDINTPIKSISFTADVWPFILTTPQGFDIPLDPETNEYIITEQQLNVRNNGPHPVKLRNIDFKGLDVNIDGEVGVMLEPGDEADFTVAFADPEAIPAAPPRSWIILRLEIESEKGKMVSSKNVRFNFPRKRK
jgi:hypothetical protein